MDYAEALKEADKKPKPGYMEVTFRYDSHLILPYKDGLLLLQALQQAEQYNRGYSDTPPTLKALDHDDLTVVPMSAHEYQRAKMAQLMGISLRELKEPEPGKE